MAVSILNNIPSLAAQNQLAITGSNLQKTLFALSSGSRINTGADDAAGLAIANGLQANITALTQSSRNANDGVGFLQVADGALAQVTTLLNRAVTLATESATGSVTQRTALNSEFTAIQNEITRIGNTTTYNGTQVFSGSTLNVFLSDASTNSTIGLTTGALSPTAIGLSTAANGSLAITTAPAAGKDSIAIGGQTYNFVAAPAVNGDVAAGADAASAMANLVAAINGDSHNVANANVSAAMSSDGSSIILTAKTSGTAGNGAGYGVTMTTGASGGTLAATLGGTALVSGTAADLTGGGLAIDLSSAPDATAALGAVNNAIQYVAGMRGTIGANINRLQSASNVMNNQVQNLTSAEDGITAADIPAAVANLTKYSILNQTAISALSQANQMQQSVLALLK
jgi:flagellin